MHFQNSNAASLMHSLILFFPQHLSNHVASKSSFRTLKASQCFYIQCWTSRNLDWHIQIASTRFLNPWEMTTLSRIDIPLEIGAQLHFITIECYQIVSLKGLEHILFANFNSSIFSNLKVFVAYLKHRVLTNLRENQEKYLPLCEPHMHGSRRGTDEHFSFGKC